MKTMRLVCKALLLGLLMFCSATQARAAGWMDFWDYLDSLSGPGPFNGFGMEGPIICDNGAGPTVKCYGRDPRVGENRRRYDIGPDVSFLKGQINDHLVYPIGTTDDQKHVNALTYGAHANIWFPHHLGATVRVTRVRFSGPLVRDGSLSSTIFSVGPVFRIPLNRTFEVDITPLAQFGLGPFSVSDFGAVSPQLKSDKAKLGLHIGIGF